jgi:hypothetical protein
MLQQPGWALSQGLSVGLARAEAFNTLVFGEIGYSITTRFIKASTLHPRVFKGNPWCVRVCVGMCSPLCCSHLMVFLTHRCAIKKLTGLLPSCARRLWLPLRRIWVSISVTAALQVALTYIPGLNAFFGESGPGHSCSCSN